MPALTYRFRLGLSPDLDVWGEAFSGHELHVCGAPDDDRRRWWRSPVARLARGGSTHLSGVGVVWGRGAALEGLVERAPESLVLVLTDEDPPSLDLERVILVRLRDRPIRVEVEVRVEGKDVSRDVLIEEIET